MPSSLSCTKYASGIVVFAVTFLFCQSVLAALSCTFSTAAACVSPSVVVLRMASSTNSHSELPSQSNAAYSNNVICCGGVASLSNSCSGSSVVVVNLASTTNSHVEENTFSDYTNHACLSVPTGSGTLSIAYQANNCSGYNTTLASIVSSTNSHIGTSTSYTTQICASFLASQALSFNISDNTIGFGALSSSAARYATGDALGSATAVAAHTITVATNAASGYTLSVEGGTLSSGASTISAIGSTNTASAPGTSQFGMDASASGGSGSVLSPYAASGFAYAASATTTSNVASDSVGDGANTVYSIYYIANITGSTPSNSYSTTLTYQITANF